MAGQSLRGDDSVSLCRLGAGVRHLIARAGGEHSEEYPPTCIASDRICHRNLPVSIEEPKFVRVPRIHKGHTPVHKRITRIDRLFDLHKNFSRNLSNTDLCRCAVYLSMDEPILFLTAFNLFLGKGHIKSDVIGSKPVVTL